MSFLPLRRRLLIQSPGQQPFYGGREIEELRAKLGAIIKAEDHKALEVIALTVESLYNRPQGKVHEETMDIGFPEVLVFLGALLVLLFVGLVILALRRLSSKRWPLLGLFFLVGVLVRVRDGLALPEIAAVLGLCVIVLWLVVWLWGRFGT